MAEFTTRPVVMGTFGVVAAGHYLAAAVGMHVLESGGNAVDAGVAAGFALNLVKPQSNGIGGEAPILIYRAGDGAGPRIAAINGQGSAPRRATIDWFRGEGIEVIPGDGFLPATVPAAFGSWVTALLHYGRLGLKETLGPVVELARGGFAVYPALRDAIARNADKYREQWPSTAEIYLDGGRVPSVGWLLRQPVWAGTFQGALDVEARERQRGREAALRAALDYFYRGPVAERAAAFAGSTEVLDASGRPHRGLIEASDFAEFRTTVEEPVTLRYRGVDVYKCGPWSQGPVFLQQLGLLEGFDLAGMGHNSTAYVHTVVEAAKLAFADRERYYGDPAFVDVPLERLLSKEYAARRRELIDPTVASPDLRPGDAPATQPRVVAGDPRVYTGDTTHLDVIDAAGNMFAATPSGGWIPSSPVVPGLGFPLGTRGQQFYLDPTHPDALAPGKRPRTTLTPSLAMRDGQPWMVFGTPGGDQQDQWSLQFFLNVVDFGMNLQAAVDAPSFHTQHFPSSFYPHGALPRRVVVEGRIAPRVREELAAMGHEVVVAGDWANGQVTAVRVDPRSGLIEGAASPRGMTAYAIGR
ncbi:MAG TPA: gamma-glutamyltransferase family protein [Chloroflexota bacterium]|nr:gamma-glutamyltransferase family protein [Chloroflexota bacterium]